MPFCQQFFLTLSPTTAIIAHDPISEVTDINKQKFLAELGKLLTFMYEEDRQNALALYGRMFDKAEDEMALLQLLVSPTRQAVIVARAYNARERKLQVYSQSREDEAPAYSNGEIPDYARAISQIHQTAVAQHIIAPDVASGQFTLFQDDDSGFTETYQYEENGPQSQTAAPAPAPAEPAVPVTPAVPVSMPESAPAEPAPVPAESAEPAVTAAAVPAEAPVPAPAEDELPAAPVPDAEPEEAVPAPPEAPAAPAPVDVDAFVENFSIADSEMDAAPAAPEGPAEESEAASAALAAAEAVEPVPVPEDEPEPVPAAPTRTVRKPRIFLLLVYILFAVPLTLIGVTVLLIPTLFFLVLGVSVLATGAVVLAAAFSGFSVLADIMVVLGAGLIVFALGLLLFWIFIWFIGGAIVGLVRGVLSLGSRWCYKEVPVV